MGLSTVFTPKRFFGVLPGCLNPDSSSGSTAVLVVVVLVVVVIAPATT